MALAVKTCLFCGVEDEVNDCDDVKAHRELSLSSQPVPAIMDNNGARGMH